MSTLSDAIRLAKYYLATGGSGSNLHDIERSWLVSKIGSDSGGTISDLWREYLAVPPGGSLNDGLLLYWSGGGENPPIDFSMGVLDPSITFARSSTGTYIGSDGLQKTAAIDGPRFDHDPITGNMRGLLVEEQRTNRISNSSGLDSAVWIKTSATITADAVPAPDGATAADLITDNSNTSHHLAYFSAPVMGDAVCARSVYVKKATSRYVAFGVAAVLSSDSNTWVFDFDTGTFTLAGTAGAGQKATPLANGWWRIEIYNVSTGANNSKLSVAVSSGPDRASTYYAGDGSLSVYAWGAQFEVGSYASSHIPTTAAAVTRSADVASFTIPPRVVRLVTTYDDGTTNTETVTPGASYVIPTGQKPILYIQGYSE